MRRKEFDMTEDRREVEDFLQEMTHGFLGTIGPDGWPAVTPLNYVFVNGAVYFHGSRIGAKMNAIAADARVTFTVAREYAIIPSYFTDPVMACPASTYFKSVAITGYACEVDNLEEKATALESFMRKLQPEGGYKTIAADDKDYKPRLKGVCVVKIDPENITAKFKFGQNLKEETRVHVMHMLKERNRPLDAEAAALMRQYCPHADRSRD